MDLDRFRQVNESFGHQAGDEVIKAFADRLSALARPADVVARIGGDAFAVLASGLRGEDDVAALCERIGAAAASPFEVAGATVRASASIGVAIMRRPASRHTEPMRKAEIALGRAKASGGGWHVFAPEADEDPQRHQIEAELRQALGDGTGLEVHYQPLHSAARNAVTGVEALLRWRHPTRGMLGPRQFVPIAEEAGLIGRLGDWTLRSACRALKRWPGLALAVNVSPLQLREPTFAPRLLGILDGEGFAPARLEIEITENALFDMDGAVACSLQELRAEGVKVALDDFGTGYSSLSHLRRLEIDKVKIDPSFVHRIGRSEESAAMVEAVANIGRAHGLAVAAEGVETEEQRAFLADAGCAELQGYLFSRPMPLDDLAAMLDQQPGLLSAA
jgi:diguanylate cyclase (GGDEF)-like protein